jgi:uncharacterized protein involved in exopolysaccharide biosynthesis
MPPDAWTPAYDAPAPFRGREGRVRPRYGPDDIITLLWRERLLMLGVFLAFALAGLAFAFTLKTAYPAQASLLVRLGQEYVYEPRAGDAGRGVAPESDQVLQAEVEILSSAQLKARVVDKLTLARLYPKLAQGYDAATLEERRQRVSQAVAAMERSLKITSAPGTPIVRLSYEDTDPQRAALVLNTLLEQYLIYRRTVLLDAAAPLEDQRKAFEARLAQADAAYENFLGSNNIGDFEAEKTSLGQLQASLQQQKYNIDAQLSDRQGRLDALQGQAAQAPAEVVLYHDVDHAAQDKLTDLRLQREALLSRYQPDAAPVRELDAQIGVLQQAIAEGRVQGEGVRRVGANPIYQALQTDRIQIAAEIAALQRTSEALSGQIEQVTERQLRLAQLEPQYQGLARDRDVLQNNVRDFTVKEQVTQAADAMARESNDNISIVQNAVAPIQGKSLRKPVIVLSLTLAAFTALCAGMLRIFLRPGLLTPASAGRTLDLPVLATVGVKRADRR